VALYINYRPVKTLIDTGAVASCISEKMARVLKLKPQRSSDEIRLVSANQTPIESTGVVQVELSIQGLVIPFTLYVLKSLAHNMILGNDFLRTTGAIINCAEGSISLFEGLVITSLTTQYEQHNVLRLANNVSIPPQSEALINLIVPPRFRHRTSLMETYESIKNQFLMVAGAVIHPTLCKTLCRIVNVGLVPPKLRVNTPIARISYIDMNDPNNKAMMSVDVNDNMATVSKEVNLISHEDRVKFLQSKGLTLENPNLSSDQQSQLSALLYEFQEIF